MKNGADPSFSQTVVVFIIGVILFLVIVLAVQVLFYNVQFGEERSKVYAARPQELTELQARQLAQINTYRYVSEKDGLVAIPIDRAIELYVAGVKATPTPTTMKASDREPGSRPAEGRAP